ncbi:MAG: DUF6015 family protein [Thermoplasmatota archaeon]
MNIITVYDLSTAIEEKLHINKKEAKKIAITILDFFGFDDRIIDNQLEHKERQLFYMLETQGLLTTQRELITLMDGRQWRIHYWILAKNTILRFSKHKYLSYSNKEMVASSNDTIYSYLNKDMWTTRKIDL